jgi:predicted RNase H-like HicB family nuclease
MDYQLTAIYHKVQEGYIAFVEELPGANSQGATLDEARENLPEAIEMVIDANRTISGRGLGGAKVIREPIKVSA